MFKKKKVKKIEKHWSIAFWLSIPCSFFVGGICFITSLSLTSQQIFNGEVWSLFLMGLLSSMSLLWLLPLTRTRVFIHELKHALMVMFVGGTLKGMKVRKDQGAVSYEMPEEKAHYGPAIALAPYCLPLFSLIVLAMCLVFETNHRLILGLLLGISLGLDLALSISEVRPVQTDFKTVVGGFLFSAAYIAGWLFLWANLCVLWVVGGRQAFLVAFAVGMEAMRGLFPEVFRAM